MHILSKIDKLIWISSMLVITVVFFLSNSFFIPTLIVSLIGVTSLIFTAKCHIAGPVLMLFFSVIYGVISFYFAYYGEVATYVGMTAPITALSIFEWKRNPYKAGNYEVKIAHVSNIKWVIAIFLSIIVTIVFYFILGFFETKFLLLSTLSVLTSFLAVVLTFFRSEFYAIAYAFNDIVLIVLWYLASLDDSSYYTMVVCFAVFLINDIYGFYSWRKIKKKQI